MNWLQRFMMGRYGTDNLGLALMVAGMVCSLVSSIFGWTFVWLLSYVCFGWMLFRMLSRNIPARRRENDAAAKFFRPMGQKLAPLMQKAGRKLRLWHQMWQCRKTHRYYKCPKCRQQVRVPRNKGKIRIVCPRCRGDFIRKT